MRRPLRTRPAALAGAGLLALVSTSCSIQTKQAETSAIIGAVDRALAGPALDATLSVAITPKASRRPLPPGPGLLQAATADKLGLEVDPRSQRAAVLGADGQPVMYFSGGTFFERRATSGASAAFGSLGAPTNITTLSLSVPTLSKPSTASSALQQLSASAQAAMAVQARVDQTAGIGTRPWLELDYSSIPLDERGRELAGSYAISPWLVIDLGKGVLTGSVRRVPADGTGVPAGLPALVGPGSTLYRVNFGLQKATKQLPSAQQQTVARVMAANAVDGSVFSGYVWLTAGHQLGGLVVDFGQHLDSQQGAVLSVTVAIGSGSAGGSGPPSGFPSAPGSSQVVQVDSLGSLVNSVAAQ